MTDQIELAPGVEDRARGGYSLRRRASAYFRTNPLILLERFGLLIALVVLLVGFSVSGVGPLFTSSDNVEYLLTGGAVVGIIALAMVPPLVAGHFDLSVAAIAAVSNIATASAIGIHGLPVAVGIAIGVVAGALIGLVNGFLVAKLKLSAFIVTFGMYILLDGLTTLYTGGAQIVSGIPASLGAWSGQDFLGVPRPFVALLVVALVLWFALSNLPWGRFLEAIGSNEAASRLVGISVDRSVWVAFVVSGALAGVAGALLTSVLGGGDPTAARSYLFPAFAAVFLGSTAIRPGSYNVVGTLLGVYFVGTAVSGLSLMGVQTWVQSVFNGAALILAVAVAAYLARARRIRDARSATRSISPPLRASSPSDPEPKAPRS